jgi:hypothetical protein
MHRTARTIFLFSILATGCSSSSSGTPTPTGSDAGDDASSSTGDAGGSTQPGLDATAEASEPEMEAAPAPVCDAVSLAVMDAGDDVPCFQCQATMCTALVTACSTDCLCAPAYNCLQQNSPQGLNSGYSACPGAIDAISNSDPGLTALAACATEMCHDQCYPQ